VPGPLDGIVVLDWTHALAGPFCGLILADLGADVIKVEAPGNADGSHGGHPFVTGPGGQTESGALLMVNRNKRGIAVDLKDEAARRAFHRLVARADVLIQNFRPGTMKKLGCDYETLRAINPGLIYCSVSGFGQFGPYSDRAGVDLITQGMSGLMSITGEPGGEPVKAGVPVCDTGTGMYGAIGILAALHERARSGLGQHVDVCLMDTPISWMVWEAAQYFATGEVPDRLGSGHRLGVPYRAYEAADGRWLTIGASGNKHFAAVCEILGAPELATDERFDSGSKRRQRRKELTAILRELFKRQPAAHWIDRLAAAGVPAGPINRVDHVLDREPHVKERKLVVETDHPTVGRQRALATPIKLSRTEVAVRRPAPRHGEHTADVLRWAGVPDDEIASLAASGAIRSLEATAPQREAAPVAP
jgi:crotonobetainyl-CoA:carnitine CoA-transferase CaiB-like acyl-CoA transferase